MKTSTVLDKRMVQSLSEVNCKPLQHSLLARVININDFDHYDFNLGIVTPSNVNNKLASKGAFLFLPPKGVGFECFDTVTQIASKLADASGQVAVFLIDQDLDNNELHIFKLFAALKWMCSQESEFVLDSSKVSIVGTQLGAHMAIVLTIMALQNSFPAISHQILINPKFFDCTSYQLTNSRRGGSSIADRKDSSQEWLNVQSVYNLPLDLPIRDFLGISPTFVQLSANNGYNCELEYYCAKLFQAGASVSYANYDENGEECLVEFEPYLSGSLLNDTAAELRKSGQD